MIFKTKIKLLIVAISFFVVSFVFSSVAGASDYQYKILDPKYNPYAEQIIKDGYKQTNGYKTIKTDKGFDFGRFFVIFVSISFPLFIISLVMKSFRRVTEDVVGRNVVFENEIEIKTVDEVEDNNLVESSVNEVRMEIESQFDSECIDYVDNNLVINDTINSSMTSPIMSLHNNIHNKIIIGQNKGLGFIEKNQKSTLVGFINEKIFELNDFSEYKTNEIRAKLLETVDEKDRYIVRMEKYKALVEVSDEKIDLILEL